MDDALRVYRDLDYDGSHAIVEQELNEDVVLGESLLLSFDVRIDDHNFGRYDSWNAYPANVWVDYEDSLGTPFTFRRSYYNFVSDADKREAVKRLRRDTG